MASDEHSKDAPATATIAVHGVEDLHQPFGTVVSLVFHSSTYGFQAIHYCRAIVSRSWLS